MLKVHVVIGEEICCIFKVEEKNGDVVKGIYLRQKPPYETEVINDNLETALKEHLGSEVEFITYKMDAPGMYSLIGVKKNKLIDILEDGTIGFQEELNFI